MDTKRLGELLVTRNIITSEQLEDALAEQRRTGKFLGDIIVKKGFAGEDDVAQGLSAQLGFAYIDLEKYNIEPGIVKLLPRDMAEKYKAIPLFKSATAITVAMVNPLDVNAIDDIQRALGVRVKPVFATSGLINKRINEEYQKISAPQAVSQQEIDVTLVSDADSVKIASLAPIVSIVDNLVAKAVEMNASDIHLEPQNKFFYCRYRIDGILHDMPQLPKKYEAAVISRIKIMASMDIAEKRLPQDGRIQTFVGNRSIDLRISTFPTMHGENVVIRILDKSRSLIKLNELGMAGNVLKQFEEIITKPHGVILVTGPTGSGKTTTLYAVLTKLNSVDKNIVTMEDPIEYEVDRVRQSQVNVKAGVTFAAGLRSIVRQDPDIIMIGEIRDHETAEIAIHAALTGHVVFSTLHTNDAPSSVTRLIDMGIDSFLVSSALICVLAQRLVRVLCPNCKEPYKPVKEIFDQLKIEYNDSYTFYNEKGCSHCRNTGYVGRMAIFELFVPDDDLKKLIDKKVPASEIRDMAIHKGMKTLREDGMEKLINGTTSLSEILRMTLAG